MVADIRIGKYGSAGKSEIVTTMPDALAPYAAMLDAAVVDDGTSSIHGVGRRYVLRSDGAVVYRFVPEVLEFWRKK